MPAFRRIDLQNDRAARHLQLAARTILHSLPNPSGRAVDTVLKALAKAYGVLPLQRVAMVREAIIKSPLARRAETLRAAHVMLEAVLHDLGKSTVRDASPATDDGFGTMSAWLEAIGDKGWKVTKKQEEVFDEAGADGFELSARYLDQVAAPATALVPRDQQYGEVSLPVLLLRGYSIPPPVLRNWSEASPRLEVTIVYGQYVAIQPIKCVGLHFSLVEMKDGSLALGRFPQVAACLDLDAGATILAPRRVGQHYYCPLFDPHDEARRHFRDWHPIVQ